MTTSRKDAWHLAALVFTQLAAMALVIALVGCGTGHTRTVIIRQPVKVVRVNPQPVKRIVIVKKVCAQYNPRTRTCLRYDIR